MRYAFVSVAVCVAIRNGIIQQRYDTDRDGNQNRKSLWACVPFVMYKAHSIMPSSIQVIWVCCWCELTYMFAFVHVTNTAMSWCLCATKRLSECVRLIFIQWMVFDGWKHSLCAVLCVLELTGLLHRSKQCLRFIMSQNVSMQILKRHKNEMAWQAREQRCHIVESPFHAYF